MTDKRDQPPPFEDTLSIEVLRAEVRTLWDRELALNHDLMDLPEVPSLHTMRALCTAAMGIATKDLDLFSEGNRLQREHPGKVPYKCEYERAAGLWVFIRAGILAAKAEAS